MSWLFVCDLCGFTTTSPIAFKQHVEEHSSHWWVHLALGYRFGRDK